jgi:chemotaxis protein histidine kinase CheA
MAAGVPYMAAGGASSSDNSREMARKKKEEKEAAEAVAAVDAAIRKEEATKREAAAKAKREEAEKAKRAKAAEAAKAKREAADAAKAKREAAAAEAAKREAAEAAKAKREAAEEAEVAAAVEAIAEAEAAEAVEADARYAQSIADDQGRTPATGGSGVTHRGQNEFFSNLAVGGALSNEQFEMFVLATGGYGDAAPQNRLSTTHCGSDLVVYDTNGRKHEIGMQCFIKCVQMAYKRRGITLTDQELAYLTKNISAENVTAASAKAASKPYSPEDIKYACARFGFHVTVKSPGEYDKSFGDVNAAVKFEVELAHGHYRLIDQ